MHCCMYTIGRIASLTHCFHVPAPGRQCIAGTRVVEHSKHPLTGVDSVWAARPVGRLSPLQGKHLLARGRPGAAAALLVMVFGTLPILSAAMGRVKADAGRPLRASPH